MSDLKFRELPAPVKVCLLIGVLMAILDEADDAGKKLIETICSNIGFSQEDAEAACDISDEEMEIMMQYAESHSA